MYGKWEDNEDTRTLILMILKEPFVKPVVELAIIWYIHKQHIILFFVDMKI